MNANELVRDIGAGEASSGFGDYDSSRNFYSLYVQCEEGNAAGHRTAEDYTLTFTRNRSSA